MLRSTINLFTTSDFQMRSCCPSFCGGYRRGKPYSLTSMRETQYSNIKSHYTEMYSYPGLIFRRGIPFKIDVQAYNADLDATSIAVELTACGEGSKTIILDDNFPNSDSFGWKYEFSEYADADSVITLRICSPSDAIVGQYSMTVYFNKKAIGTQEFILLFNPFCPDDDVYMPSEDELQEYVFNDATNIYMGTEDYIVPKSWDVGQFEACSVQAALMLLNCMPTVTRSRAFEVSRQLSALINSNDDNGILMGNWSGKYYDGTSPMSWDGSAAILAKYARTGRPVKYGQCWVFCGVLCSVLRTIGIPCRCITNYCSLHDTDGSLKWEIFLDENFNPINNGGDSCWNFHCWNEAWMRRPDLGSEHDGWQVLDATPQERSGGLFRLGPASKTAVKNGLVELPYDVGFVYAEVNADKVFFLRQPDGTFKHYMVKKNELGRLVITKQALSDEYEDITKEYKDEEVTMDRLIDNEHTRMRLGENSITRSIKIEIVCPSSVSLTEDLCGTIIVHGLSHRMENLLKAEARLMSYTGRNICILYEASEKVNSSDRNIEFKIDKEALSGAVQEEFPFIKVKVYCFDSNQDELGCSEKVISVKTPDVEILGIPSTCAVGTKCLVTVAVSNPLNVPLTNTKLRISFTDDKTRKVKFKTVYPGKRIAQDIIVTPKCVGMKKLHVSLESEECSGFSNVAKFKAV
ncbi:Protein-glutamine gamma-glutamyltransferase K [Thelohanellus kitauei]|uniref:Protein-glutamine gamma-glutamyltransferase K n=1 Tax=Thelohanellus kitauei TaxID=669202 RepID=A0A0C2I6Y8_THEKT|nr:Protein-glutamine gamma-glutamyltransferase K [Thelohanellus kitauei]